MNIENIVSKIENNYGAKEFDFTKEGRPFPSRDDVIAIVKGLQKVVFPGYFGTRSLRGENVSYFIGDSIIELRSELYTQVYAALCCVCLGKHEERGFDLDLQTEEQVKERAEFVCDSFFEQLPEVQAMLLKDVQAAYDGDPAAQSKQEIIYSYPGLLAVFVYRVAHVLYSLCVPLIPRIMTEYAHSRTGTDINAGATIGEYFFIDHATGVVIGETTVIGNHVKLYQGVTLGALSIKDGKSLAGKRRHPTICDNVVIYSNASILGGETVIGENSVIGGNAFITSSVPANTMVSARPAELSMRTSE